MRPRWRIVPGFPDYEASACGKVRRRTLGRGTWPGRMLSPRRNDQGYLIVTLNGKVPMAVHRIVCRTFNGRPPSPHHEACHQNGRKRDNRSKNLRWKTHRENIEDKNRHGTMVRGERHPKALLHPASIRRIRRLVPRGRVPRGTLTALADHYGVSRQAIWLVVRGHNWRHVK